MKTSEKPKIFFTVATVHVPRYGELIASEKRALPRLQKELNEANQLKMESHRTMMSRHRKRNLLHVRNTTMSSEMKPLTNKGLYNIKI